MKEYEVPIRVSFDGVLRVKAECVEEARHKVKVHMREHKDQYKLILEYGVGTITVGRKVAEVTEEERCP